jgi:epsilon-lactone hydrolase
MSEAPGTVHLPAREIPIPTSVSPEAQSVLAMGKVGPPTDVALPALDDTVGWKAYVAESDGFVRSMVGGRLADFKGTIEERIVGSCVLYVVIPEGVAPDDRRVYFDIHGGAFILGGGELCKMTAVTAATQMGATVWSLDYRMAPDHPFPTPLDDLLAAYRVLLDERRPEEIIVGGASAGGNLSAALLLRAKDEGLSMPAAVVFTTGAFDATGGGDSRWTNDGLDNLLSSSGHPCVELHIGGHDPRHPYLSPLFGDVSGFPPAILTTGTRDLLLSDNVRMHRHLRAAGVAAELHVWEASGHGGFLGMAPEDADRFAEIRRFVDEHWAGAAVS